MAAAADKRARRKEGSSSIRPEFGNHTCDICNKDCHSHISLFSHNQFAYMFVFVKQNMLTNRKDRRRLPNREVLSRSSIRRKWSCPRPVPMVAPGGHFLCKSASKKNEWSTGYSRYLLLLLLLCKAAFYCCIVARWRSGQEGLVRSWTISPTLWLYHCFVQKGCRGHARPKIGNVYFLCLSVCIANRIGSSLFSHNRCKYRIFAFTFERRM